MRLINGVGVLNTLDEFLDPAHAALAIVDVQNDFCHPDGHFARHGKDLGSTRAALPQLISFVNAAQDLGIRAVFIRQITLPHGLSDSPAWLRFKCRDGKSPDYTLKGSWGAKLVDGLNPRAQDLVVEKLRPDAFLNTNLDHLLRVSGIKTVVVLGTTTEGCVESTIRGASYHDYYVVVVSDLVTSPNPDLHAGSSRLLEARYPMATSNEILNVWRQTKPGQDAQRSNRPLLNG